MDLKLNFMGIVAADWPKTYEFYHDTLGLQTLLNPQFYDYWAVLGGNGEMNRTGTKVELFDLGKRPERDQAWGKGQGVRPSIQVDNLEAAIEMLQARGIAFNGAIEETPWGERIEFSAAEQFRWSLSHIPGKPFTSDMRKPFIGHFELKVHDFEGQKAFYGDLLQMRLGAEGENYAILGQGEGEPWIALEPGGEAQAIHPNWANNPIRSQPLFMSFMTSDVESAAQHLRAVGVSILNEVTSYPDWGGTELVAADADGNVLQIVQYGHF